MVDRAATGKTFCFCYLTYGSWTENRMDSLYQTVNGLVGNVDWGESLSVVACEFLGLNKTFCRCFDQRMNAELGAEMTKI